MPRIRSVQKKVGNEEKKIKTLQCLLLCDGKEKQEKEENKGKSQSIKEKNDEGKLIQNESSNR